MMWDGPRNHHGQRLWYAPDRGVVGGSLIASPVGGVLIGGSSSTQVVAWDHKDLTLTANSLYANRDLAAANPLGEPSPTAFEDEYVLGNSAGGPENLARSVDPQGIINNVYNGPKHGKIITWQGSADQLIRWRGLGLLLSDGRYNIQPAEGYGRRAATTKLCWDAVLVALLPCPRRGTLRRWRGGESHHRHTARRQ